MSGLFCADPKFLYPSENAEFMLEVYENGEVSLLNFVNRTATTFEDMETITDLCNMMFKAVIDYEIREYKKQLELNKRSSWSSEDDLQQLISDFVEDHDHFTHCGFCEKAKGKENMSWYAKQYSAGGRHFMFMCLDCANSPDGVGFIQCEPVPPDDLDDIPF